MTRDILLNDILSDGAGKGSVVDMCMLHLDVCLIVPPLHVHLGRE